MSDELTQEDLDEQAERLVEKRAEITRLRAVQADNHQAAGLGIDKAKLDEEEARLDAELEEAKRLADPDVINASLPGLADRQAAMQAEVAAQEAADAQAAADAAAADAKPDTKAQAKAKADAKKDESADLSLDADKKGE